MKISKKLIIPIWFLFLGLFSAQAHPFYVSLCQIDYNEQNQSLEISVKVFVDDLLVALTEEGHNKLYIGEDREDEKADEYIFDYLQKKLHIKVNDKALQANFVGKEMEKDVVWTYLEIGNVPALDEIEVSCSILTDIFDDQSNIIQVNKDGEIKNLLLSKRKTQGKLDFAKK